ncbi:chemotaxis protein CheW [Halioxenophilus sp. WMMB6]|uniref:chemotaxis protein CheW n=1 Tax=Halioxenophilus sp. WMMB6 TaxID=3073815 RepID=UPI00295E50F7|nr:chemotaxis protein CheW [Halioxenophilus sp. WMMB6]
MSSLAQEYLTFLLDGEEFGVDILCVQEIMVWTPVTVIPGTPDYLRGVINLRGCIVPIVDMRQRFGRAPVDYTETTVVIVLRTSDGERSVVVGLVVDAVSEVYKVASVDIKEAPDFGGHIDSRFVRGLATVDNKLIILLNATRLLNVKDLYGVVAQARPVPSSESAADRQPANWS